MANAKGRRLAGRRQPASPRSERPCSQKKRFVFPLVLFGGITSIFVLVGAVALLGSLGGDSGETDTAQSNGLARQLVDPADLDIETEVASETELPERADPLEVTNALVREVSIEEFTQASANLADANIVDEYTPGDAYRRSDYADGWGDADGDCISDRHEILLERSEVPAVLNDCQVVTGQWTDPYDGTVYADANDVTIDHFVPIAAAHRAGGWAWDSATKAAFAADIEFEPSLLTVGQDTNQAKGDKEPDEWRPGEETWCVYAINWISVKTRWELEFSTSEAQALQEMLDTCVVVEAETTSSTTTTTIEPVDPTTTTSTSSTTTTIDVVDGPAIVEVIRCDARGEAVELVNRGGETITLRGWLIHDVGNNHEGDLGPITLGPGQRVVLLSGEDTLDTAGVYRWANDNVWNNDGDTATLLNPNGIIVSRLRCST